MKKIISVSIGIPAYNEEANIQQLLISLCDQKQQGFSLSEIIIISDGSSDRTVQEVSHVHDKRIYMVASQKRKGKSYRLNQLFRMFTGDVLFILDADILIKDPYLFSKIIQSTDFKRDGIVGVNAIPLLAHTIFEKIISVSAFIIRDIAMSWNDGRNYLGFRGCFLGFDGDFAKSIVLPEGLVNDDAYLYILARQRGYLSYYARNASVFFRSPATFADHCSQSSRYQDAKHELSKYFAGDISDMYKTPFLLTVKSTLRYLLLYPLEVLSYFVVRLLTKILRQRKLSTQWAIAKSTKLLILNELFIF